MHRLASNLAKALHQDSTAKFVMQPKTIFSFQATTIRIHQQQTVSFAPPGHTSGRQCSPVTKQKKCRTQHFRTIPRSQRLDHGQVLCAPEKGKKLVWCISRTDAVSVQFPRRQVAYREVMARLATFLAPTSSSLCCTGSSSLAGDQRNSHRACNMTC